MSEFARDPYRGWKITAMIMAAGVVILSLTGIFTQAKTSVIFTALPLGAVMCASSGIMALVKGRRFLGYLCSGLAGLFLVVLIAWVVRLIW